MYQLTFYYYKQLFLFQCFTISICFSLPKALSTFKQELTEDPIIRVCVCHECRIMFYFNVIVLYLFKGLIMSLSGAYHCQKWLAGLMQL